MNTTNTINTTNTTNVAQNNHANIPPFKLNGGLYTGTPFEQNAPWANVPIRPSSAYMTHYGLTLKNKYDNQTPSMSFYQMTPGYRPGNNTDDTITGLVSCDGLSCVPLPTCEHKPKKCMKIIPIT